MAQALDLVINRAVLFDKCIGVRNVCLGLIIIVITYKVLDRVIREKLTELRAQLRGEGLVMRKNERWAVEPFYNACHRKGLARARNAEEHLLIKAVFDAAHERLYGLRLIAHRRI